MARDSASRANNSPPDAEVPAPAHNGSTATDRAGRDERRRGWFWHWNGIVTQYVPLIGLKGVGLLNSYTVWTDRREDSPHRGYAFPSQQSEANFYGEDRSELITINKILVALDLIEIRKEMVRKTDEQGRRWKVPQNLYRVKDRQDGLDLTTADVIRVVELADKDKAVYRNIRKIFSAKFEPIDRNNVWNEILKEVEGHPTWTKLAALATKQEARASARTKAGHRSRARKQEQSSEEKGPPAATGTGSSQEPDSHAGKRSPTILTTGHIRHSSFEMSEHSGPEDRQPQTIAALPSNGSTPAAEKSNNGSAGADDESSNGLHEIERGSVADTNNGHESSVEPGNTMYYQSSSTITTTTTRSPEDAGEAQPPGHSEGDREPDRRSSERQSERRTTVDPAGTGRAPTPEDGSGLVAGNAAPGGGSPERGLAGDAAGGPLGDPSPLVVSLYEAANDRAATRLERILLSELEADAAAPAQAAGSSGPEWVAAALREAVGSGSAFVAPKRIREIVNRWASSGSGPRGQSPEDADNIHETRHAKSETDKRRSITTHELETSRDAISRVETLTVPAGDAAQGSRLWDVVLDILGSDRAAGNLSRLRGVMPIGERSDGAFVLGAPTRLAARLLDGTHRQAVEQALSSLLPSRVSIVVLPPDQWKTEDE